MTFDYTSFKLDIDQLIRSIAISTIFIFSLYAVKTLDFFYDYDLSFLGVSPLEFEGLVGVFLAPLIHGSFFHLHTNTLHLFILSISILYFLRKKGMVGLAWVYIGSGICVWVAGRDAYHIGSSGLVYGFYACALICGVLNRNIFFIIICLSILYYQPNFFEGLLPSDNATSWEYHLLGFCNGLFIGTKLSLVDY